MEEKECLLLLRNIVSFLESMKRNHHINDNDCWYSCPASGDCCNDELKGCNCGASNANSAINKQIAKIELMLSKEL